MGFSGLPDWGQLYQNPIAQLAAPYEFGHYAVMPNALGIASTAQGYPDFHLRLIRGNRITPYGVLEMRLQFHYPMAEGLEVARQQDPRSRLMPWIPRSGYVRFLPRATAEPIPPEILQPMAIASNYLDQVRLQLSLSQTNAVFLKSCLAERAWPLSAIAEVELEGVLPRLPVRVRFNPSEVITDLFKLSEGNRRIHWEKATHYIQQSFGQPLGKDSVISKGTIQIIGEISADEIPEMSVAIVGRIRNRWGKFLPSSEADPAEQFQLVSEIPTGQFEWNLGEAELGVRSRCLTLDAFDSVTQVIQTQGLEAIVQETDVPPFPTGVFPVSMSANLPSQRLGVLRLGVNLRVPPRPPSRPQALNTSLELKAPQDIATTTLRLTPTDSLEYWVSTFAILKDATGIQRFNGSETCHRSHYLTLYPEDFPLQWITIAADPEVLEIATVRAIVQRPDGKQSVVQSFPVGTEPMAIALPVNEHAAVLEFEVTAIDPAAPLQTLKIGPMPAQDYQLSLYAFATYGPQTLILERSASTNSQSMTIELCPDVFITPLESQPTTVIHLKPQDHQREWTWFSESPFYGGYRYRHYRGSGQPAEAWSTVRWPTEPLILSPPSSSS